MNFRVFQRAFKDLWPMAKKSFGLTFVTSLFRSSLPFLNYLFMSKALTLLAQSQYNQVYQIIIQYLILFFSFQWLATWLEPIQIDEDIRVKRQIFAKPNEKLLTMNFHYADSASTHEKLHQVNRDQQQNNSSFNLIYQHTCSFLRNVPTLILSLILLAPLWRTTGPVIQGLAWVNSIWINVCLIIMVILIVIAQSGTMIIAMNQVSKMSGQILKINSLAFYMFQLLKDNETGKEIRLYHLAQRISDSIDEFKEWGELFYRKFYLGFGISNLISSIGSHLVNGAIYLLIGLRVLSGALPVGMVVQLTGAINQLMVSLEDALSFLTLFTQSEPMERFYELMDLPDEFAKGSIPIEKRLDNQYQLSVENLSFTFPGAQEPTLHQISEDFEFGKRYAIVGENGSGKTTFIKVLMRLYEPTEGKVYLNKISADKYALQEFYQLFSVVFQDFRLLALNLAENIAVSPNFDAERVMMTLTEVGLGDFVEGLPQGIQTYLGKEYDATGVNVSGGQAQKIAMARAVYKDAPIMILDEPTAALDPVSEFEIYQKFSEIVKDKTAFYISHRLSSCRFCDEILVFDQGRIVQRGSHEELVNQIGKYQELWHAQAQYYQ